VKQFFILIFFIGTFFQTQAQAGFETGGWLGVSTYFGDLNTNTRLTDIGLAGGVKLRYNFNNRIGLQISAGAGSVSADDKDSDNNFELARNLNFSSSVADVSLLLEFNFLPYEHGSRDQFWTPYLFAGFGATKFNPQTEIDGMTVDLRDLGTEGQFRGEEYSLVASHLAYGFGFKIDLSYEWSLNFEISSRRMRSDYLDDVSTVYPEMDDLEDFRGELAVRLSDRSAELPDEFFTENNLERPIGTPGSQRGNSRTKDYYIYFGVGIMYYFGDLRCPYER